MKRIALTQGKFALVDDEDFERLNQFRWYPLKGGNTFYAHRNLPRINKKRHMIKMHHEIIGKPPKGFEVDHRNGQGTDNQRHNLRFVTHRQNLQNLKNKKNQKASFRYPGICWHKRDQKWQAGIQVNGITKYLGAYQNELDAFNAYKQAIEAIGEEVIS